MVTTYTYNALQQRVGRDVDEDVTQFLWDGVNLRQESQAGVVEADYTVAPQPEPQPYCDLVSQHRDTDSNFYHFDAPWGAPANPFGWDGWLCRSRV